MSDLAWEVVETDDPSERMKRARVEGGWLYRTEVDWQYDYEAATQSGFASNYGVSVAMTFVPDKKWEFAPLTD